MCCCIAIRSIPYQESIIGFMKRPLHKPLSRHGLRHPQAPSPAQPAEPADLGVREIHAEGWKSFQWFLKIKKPASPRRRTRNGKDSAWPPSTSPCPRNPAPIPSTPASSPTSRSAVRLTPEQGRPPRKAGTLRPGDADARCRAIHGNELRTYVIDRNINYTNICTAKCIFCAFKRTAEDHDSYTLEYEQLYEKIEELTAVGGTQVLMQAA